MSDEGEGISATDNKAKALELKTKGNEAFAAKNYLTAITHYTAALAYDSANHEIYSNRAASYSMLKKYPAASSDANRCIALKTDWPKGYFRKAQALFGLGCPNMAYKYLTVSLSTLGVPCSSNAALRREILSEIGCNLRYLTLSPLYKDLPVVVKFLGEDRGGRGLVARKPLARGELIFEDRALVAARYMPCEQTDVTRNCAYCLRSTVPLAIVKDIVKAAGTEEEQLPRIDVEFPEPATPLPCPHCKTELYCNSTCLQAAWDEYHCVTCTGGNEGHPLHELLAAAKRNSSPTEPHLYFINIVTQMIARQIVLIKQEIARRQQEEEEKERDRKSKTGEGEAEAEDEPEKRDKNYQLNYYLALVDQVCDPFRTFSSPSMRTVFKDTPDQLKFYCAKLKEGLFHKSPIPLPFLFEERSFEQMFIQVSMNGASFSPKTPFEVYAERLARGFGNPPEDERARMVDMLVDHHARRRKIPLASPVNLPYWPGSCACGGLFRVHAMLNHSDEPNSFVTDRLSPDPLTVTVVALRNIKQGEEVTIDYFAGETDMGIERRRKMKEEYLIP